MEKLNYKVLYFCIVCIILISPFVFIQYVLLHTVFVDGEQLKKIFAGIFGFFLLLGFVRLQKHKLIDALFVVLFIIFLVYNFSVMSFFSENGNDTIGAFLYNYSLLVFVYPFYRIANFEKKMINRKVVVLFIILLIIIDVFGVMQYLKNDYMMSTTQINYFTNHDYIKFDILHGHVRSMSIMKSPLEFGMINALLSILFYSKILIKESRSKVNFILFLITTASVFTTISRTAILILISGLAIYSLFHIFANSKVSKKKTKKSNGTQFLKVSFILFFVATFIALVFFFFNNLISKDGFLDPTNILIRFENWNFIMSQYFNNFKELIFGLGVIQNGQYGQNYSIIIDNTYIGIIMTGGFLGLGLFISIIYFTITESIKHLKNVHPKHVPLCLTLISFFMAYLLGGLTENLMHIMFYPFLVILILKTIPIIEKSPILKTTD